MLVIIFAVLTLNARPLDLGALSLDRARTLDGQMITVWFLVAKPPYTLLGRTMVGAAERDDEAEREVVLLGKRLDVEIGKRLTVRGRFHLIHHRGDVVNGVIVPPWWEIRIREVK